MNPLRLGTWRLIRKRATHERLIVAAAGVTILLAATLLASGPVYADAVAVSGLRRTLEDASVRDATVAVSGRVTADSRESTDGRATRALAAVFAGGAAIHRSSLSDSFSLPARDGIPAGALTVFGAYDDLPGHAGLVSGAWPGRRPSAGAVDAVLPEPAAAALGLGPGDTLDVAPVRAGGEPVRVRISGVYRIDDVDDPFWWGEPLEVEGLRRVDFTTYGPLVLSEPAFQSLGAEGAEARWRAVPRLDRIEVDDLSTLRRRLGGLEDALAAPAEGDNLVVRSGLPDVLAAADRSLLVARSGVLVPSIQLGFLAGTAVLFLAGLLAERRRVEAAILRSRGARPVDVGRLAFAEGCLLALPAVLAAPWLAALSLRALNHVGPLAEIELGLVPRVGVLAYVLAALAGLVGAAALAAPTLRSAAVTAAVQERGRERPAGLLLRTRLDLVFVAFALLAYWQLRRYEGPLVESIRGNIGIDPLLVAAPALGLVAGALLALRVVPVIAGLSARAAARTQGLAAPLGAWQLARRPARNARAAVLLTLALAIGLFASAYQSTWLRSQEDRAAYEAGADLRVVPSRRTGSIPALRLATAYGSVDGVETALPVLERPVQVAGEAVPATLLALDVRRAAAIVHIRPDLVREPLSELAGRLRAGGRPLAAVALPGTPRRLELSVRLTVAPLAGEAAGSRFREQLRPSVSVVLRDGDGLLHRLPAGSPDPGGTPSRLVVEVGRASGPLSLVGLELQLAAGNRGSRRGTLTVQSLATDSAPVEAGEAPWSVSAGALQDAFLAPEILGVRRGGGALLAFDFATGARGFRDAPVTLTAVPGRTAAASAIPALATERFLERTGAEVGGVVALGPGDPGLELVGSVAGFPTLPSDAGGVIVDLGRYVDARFLNAADVGNPSAWLVDAAAGRERSVARALGAPPFSSVEVVDRAGREDRLTRDPVALGISGALMLGFAAAAVFSIVGFAVSAAVSVSERTTEFAVLRSLGLSDRQLSASLALESGATALIGLVGGLALGALVSWLVLPFVSLAGEGGRPFPEAIVELPGRAVAFLAAGLLAALAVVVAAQLAVVRRTALAPALRAGETS